MRMRSCEATAELKGDPRGFIPALESVGKWCKQTDASVKLNFAMWSLHSGCRLCQLQYPLERAFSGIVGVSSIGGSSNCYEHNPAYFIAQPELWFNPSCHRNIFITPGKASNRARSAMTTSLLQLLPPCHHLSSRLSAPLYISSASS